MKNKLRTVAGNHYGHFCLGLLFCFFLVYYQFLYLGFVDDLVYSTAAQASFSDFLHFMRYHYNYANGRTWVHVLLIAFLRFGVYPWRVFMPVCFAASVYLIARLVSPSAQSLQKTLVWTCAAFLCVNIGLYKDTLFWMTGSFNYILPVPFICLLLLSLRSGRHCGQLSPSLESPSVIIQRRIVAPGANASDGKERREKLSASPAIQTGALSSFS